MQLRKIIRIVNWKYVLLKFISYPQLYIKYITSFCDQHMMKQSPTMSKVLIVFLLASWNLSFPVTFACVDILASIGG